MLIDLFSAISNPKRLQIIHLVKSNIYTTADLAKKMNSSIQAISPHVDQLEEQKILSRNDRIIQLTGIGTALLEQINHFEFLATSREFFTDHTFGDVNLAFHNRLSELSECELIEGLSPNLTRWKQIIDSAQENLFCIFTEPPILIADKVLKKLENKINLYLLFGKNSIVTQCNDFIDKLQLTKHKPQDIIQKRKTDFVGINLIQSETMASLMFPGNDDKTDMHNSFVSNDESFLKWCNNFFYYKWNKAEPISRIRIPS